MPSISAGSLPTQAEAARDLLVQVTAELHEFGKRARQDAWWFLPQPLPPMNRRAYLDVPVWQGKAPSVAARIRMATYGEGAVPVAMVEFRAKPAKEGGPERKATIRVSLGAAARERDSLGLPSLSKASAEFRKYWLKGARHVRARKAGRASDRWWIDAETPEPVTTLALLLLVNNTRVLPVEPGTAEWDLARDLIRVTLRRRLNDAQLSLVLGTSKEDKLTGLRRFALPSDWRGLPQYLRRVVATEARRDAQPRTDLLDEETCGASDFPGAGVPRRTYYRWLKQSGIPRARRVTPAIRESLAERAGTRVLRRRAQALLTEELGKSKEAARKWLQRQLEKGRPLDQIVRELNRAVVAKHRGDESL